MPDPQYTHDPVIGEDEHVTATLPDPETESALAVAAKRLGQTLGVTATQEDSERLVGDAPVTNIDPAHYRSDPSGIECIEIVRHRNFNVGNAMKYLWRAGLKEHPGQSAREKEIEDLKKARWYLADEIERLGGVV